MASSSPASRKAGSQQANSHAPRAAAEPPFVSNAPVPKTPAPTTLASLSAPTPAGIELESALQVPPPLPSLESLAEPAGTFASSAPPPSEIPPSTVVVPHVAEGIDARFEHLLETVHRNRPQDDLDLIRRAWAFCIQQHQGQNRASGEPYIIHPLEVCQILADMEDGFDPPSPPACCMTRSKDTNVTSRPRSHNRFNEQVAPHRRGRHQARQDQVRQPRRPPGREHPQDAAGHGHRRARGASSSSPTVCTTCARSST